MNLPGCTTGAGVVQFSPDGQTLATAGDDNTVRLWHLATGREMLLFNDASMSEHSVPSDSWSPNVLSANGELLFFWDLERKKLRIEKIPTLAEIQAAETSEKTEARRQ